MKAGDTLELELDSLAPTGEASGRHDGRTILVPGAFAGEQVSVRLTHVSRQQPRAHAELRSVLRPHSGRRPSPCVHHDSGLPPRTARCTGCPLQGLAVADQRAQKRDLLAREHKLFVDEVIAAPEEFGYRHSSKRVVGGTVGQLVLGSYVRASHELAAMHACRVDHPEIVLASEELRRIADWQKIEPYDERSRSGDLRYAWFKTDGREVLLTLVTASATSRIPELAPHLRRPVGVAWSVHAGADNNLRGAAPTLLQGKNLHIDVAGVSRELGPLGFLQPNPAVAALAYADLVRDPSGHDLAGTLALDLYAGAGITTELLRARFSEVQACEAYPESAAALALPPETAQIFLQRQQLRPDLVIANPPREGLGPQVCSELQRLAPPRLHLMSCNPASLARDLAALAPTYRLTNLRAYDTLPHTPHLELVAWLERA
jgi:23S rRNA (uracil1939-C5)-methyltransferase